MTSRSDADLVDHWRSMLGDGTTDDCLISLFVRDVRGLVDRIERLERVANAAREYAAAFDQWRTGALADRPLPAALASELYVLDRPWMEP